MQWDSGIELNGGIGMNGGMRPGRRSGRNRKRRRTVMFLAAAACILLFAGAGFLVYGWFGQEEKKDFDGTFVYGGKAQAVCVLPVSDERTDRLREGIV